MFSYLFKPENGHIVGHGTRTKSIRLLFGRANITEDVCYDYSQDDSLRITVGTSHYLLPNVRREELMDVLEWVVDQPTDKLKEFLIKR